MIDGPAGGMLISGREAGNETLSGNEALRKEEPRNGAPPGNTEGWGN